MNIQLPRKTYFHLDEIARRWNVEVRDLIDFGIEGHLELSTLVCNLDVEVIHTDHANWESVDHERRCIFGLHPIYSRDLIELVNGGTARINRLKGHSGEHSMRLAPGQSAIVVTAERLLVASGELVRFEAVAAGGSTEPVIDPVLEQRNNFAEVRFGGRVYHFGLAQARVVAQLYEAAQSDDPWRAGHALLAGASSKCEKLQDLFKRKTDPNWRDLILSNRRGLYRLAIPPKPEWSGNVAYRRVVRAFRGSR